MIGGMPPLQWLLTFRAVMEAGSFAGAAKLLNLTPSAISHQMRALEGMLGRALFLRERRTVVPTEEALTYSASIGESFARLVTATSRVASGVGVRRLPIHCSPSFATLWLVPRLGRFTARYPDISVSVDTSLRQALFPLDGVDLAIRMGKGPWPGTTSHLLLREVLYPVGSAAYVQSLQKPDGTLDWERATLLHVSTVEHDWPTWLTGACMQVPQARSHLYFDTVHMAVSAASQGLGLAIGRDPLVAATLAAGRLVQAVPCAVDIETGYWLASPAGEETRREIRAFQRWVLAEAGVEAD